MNKVMPNVFVPRAVFVKSDYGKFLRDTAEDVEFFEIPAKPVRENIPEARALSLYQGVDADVFELKNKAPNTRNLVSPASYTPEVAQISNPIPEAKVKPAPEPVVVESAQKLSKTKFKKGGKIAACILVPLTAGVALYEGLKNKNGVKEAC